MNLGFLVEVPVTGSRKTQVFLKVLLLYQLCPKEKATFVLESPRSLFDVLQETIID